MSDTETLHRVSRALEADGFALSLGVASANFRGVIDIDGRPVAIRLRYSDLEFTEPPSVFLDRPPEWLRPVLPHLDEAGDLCVVDRNSYVSDRYRADAEARGIVRRAREVIQAGMTKNATAEIAREFPEHWGGKVVGIDFGSYNGPFTWGAEAGGGLKFSELRGRGRIAPVGACVTTTAQLSFSDRQKRPDTLGAFMTWAKEWDAKLPNKVMAKLTSLTAADPYILIAAPNGTIGFQLMVSARGSAQVAALRRPEGWRRAIQSAFGTGLPIQRLRGRRTDLGYALTRNGGGMLPLAGKQLVLVGCGSIGGYLARALVQLGAGFEGGRFILIDDDVLETRNLGRHVLGIAEVGKAKVTGCRALINADFPDATIVTRKSLIQKQKALVLGADILVDATGEQGVSEMLNGWMLEAEGAKQPYPTQFHAWVEGRGAAVQSFVSSDPDFACLRCLQPDHEASARFSTSRDNSPLPLEGGCGEQPFTPYGPSAPLMAASLAAQHVSDWARGNARPLLRTARLDWSATKEVKPTNPSPSARCPACTRA